MKVLKNKKLIKELFFHGRRFQTNHLTVIYILKKESVDGLKYLVGVPKKKIKKAVLRNRIKRQIRHVIFSNQVKYKTTDIIIGVIYKRNLPVNYSVLESEFLEFISFVKN